MTRVKFIHLAATLSCLLISINKFEAASIVDAKHDETVAYLQTFGYLPVENEQKIPDKLFRQALKKFQQNGHISATGKLDDDTVKLMRQPRCGVPDNFHLRVNHHRQKRYDTLTTKWHSLKITWNLDPKPYEKDEAKILNAIRQAFKIWTEHSMLKFDEIKKHDDADIRISFQKSKHRDLDPYDLDGTTLAHAFQPGQGIHGDAHFKLNVDWDFDVLANETAAPGKTSFFSVALHELGHSLGMGHSAHDDAVMYQYSLGTGTLSKDDIKGIQHIYGVPKTTSQQTTTTQGFDEEEDDRPIWDTRPLHPQSDLPDNCSMSYDAIATLRKELFIFKGKHFYRPGSSDKQAVEIHQFWSGLPRNLTHVDAVYENSEGKILFFVHQMLYIFEWRELEKEIPYARIGLGANVTSVDMIFKFPFNGIVYLFSGDSYWRYDERFNAVLNPKNEIRRAFKDVYDTDTAYVMNKILYFFKGLYHYEFDVRTMTLNRMKPYVSAAVFMNCEDLPREPPKSAVFIEVSNRFGADMPEPIDDLIDTGNGVDELPDDNDNPEKIPDEPDNAVVIEALILTILLSLLISQATPVILL